VTDCGETFVAKHQVTQYQRYAFKYGLLQDHATSDDLAAHPFLYTHNVSIPSVLFPILTAIGLEKFWVQQLLTLAAYALGLLYAFKATSYHTRSAWAGGVMLLLFATDYVHVFSFGLNALRAWHWLALFGLLYHVGRLSLEKRDSALGDRLAVAALALVAFGIGYDFWAICLFLCVAVVVLCLPHPAGAKPVVGNLLWLGAVFGVPVILRQVHVASVLGLDFWWKDFVFSAGIKVPLLKEFIQLPPMHEIDSMYREFNVVRAPATAAPGWRAISTTLYDMVKSVSVPSFGLLGIGLTLIAAAVGILTTYKWTRSALRRLLHLLSTESSIFAGGLAELTASLGPVLARLWVFLDRLLIPSAALIAVTLLALESLLIRREIQPNWMFYLWAILAMAPIVFGFISSNEKTPPALAPHTAEGGIATGRLGQIVPLLMALPFVAAAAFLAFSKGGILALALAGGLILAAIASTLLAWSMVGRAAFSSIAARCRSFWTPEVIQTAGRLGVPVLALMVILLLIGFDELPTIATRIAVDVVLVAMASAAVRLVYRPEHGEWRLHESDVRRGLALLYPAALITTVVILSYGLSDSPGSLGFRTLRYPLVASLFSVSAFLLLLGVLRPRVVLALYGALGALGAGSHRAFSGQFDRLRMFADPSGLALDTSTAKIRQTQALGGLRLLAVLAVGLAAGLAFFAPLSFHIYLKHEFPLIAAPVLLAKALVISGLGFLFWRLFLNRRPARWLVLAGLLIVVVDHGAIQLRDIQHRRPISTSWIPEAQARSNSSFTVSWVSDTVGGFTSSWTAGVAPGQEFEIAQRVRGGHRPFEFSDYFLFGQRDRAARGDAYLSPDYWLYFPTEHAANFDRVSPECSKDHWQYLWDFATRRRAMDFSPTADLWIEREAVFAKGSAVALGGRLRGSDAGLRRVEVRDRGTVLRSLNYNCIYRTFAGVFMLDPADSRSSIGFDIYAVSDRGAEVRLGTVSAKISDGARRYSRSDLLPWSREPQPSVEEMVSMNPSLSVAAAGKDFVIFDMNETRATQAKGRPPFQIKGADQEVKR
jgi:hypothetical protein